MSGSINMSGTAGTIFLANQSTALTAPPTGSLTGNPAVLDVVGYGTSNTYETAPATATSASTALERNAAGKDTDSNAADLALDAGYAGNRPGRRADRPADRPAGHEDHRRDPGHRRHQPARRQERHHRGRGHGGLPDRRLQRLLPPDRRHRR